MSAQGRDWVDEQEHLAANAPRILARVRKWCAHKGHPVTGDKYIPALEEIVAPEPEPVLDAGWPYPEKNR